LTNLTASGAVDLGRAYEQLGGSLQEQLVLLIEMNMNGARDVEGLNPNAVAVIEREYVPVLEQLGLEEAAAETAEAIAWWRDVAREAEMESQVHRAQVTKRGSGYGYLCSCGDAPNRSTRRRADAERWARLHEASAAHVAAVQARRSSRG
jgi:hypothetical protein